MGMQAGQSQQQTSLLPSLFQHLLGGSPAASGGQSMKRNTGGLGMGQSPMQGLFGQQHQTPRNAPEQGAHGMGQGFQGAKSAFSPGSSQQNSMAGQQKFTVFNNS